MRHPLLDPVHQLMQAAAAHGAYTQDLQAEGGCQTRGCSKSYGMCKTQLKDRLWSS